MEKTTPRVYQFKITLDKIDPAIWRRIQVPETYTFWDLHVAIQSAMGWTDSHLHKFTVFNPQTRRTEEIGIPDEDGELEFLAGWEFPIVAYFSLDHNQATYLYDFGDHWEHKLVLEKILPQEPGAQYPRCIEGERACPPEDCGGIWGYENLLEIMKDESHEEYESMKEWLGGSFDPERFNAKKVHFDDPEKRWAIVFGDED